MSDPKINAEVSRILDRDGKVQASVLLEESTPETAPLHDRFEWDNEIAGHEYRLNQSRKIIRVAVVTVEGSQDRMVHVPKVEREPDSPKEGWYKPARIIAKSPMEFTAAFGEALESLAASKRAMETLEKACGKSKKKDDLTARLAVAMKALDAAESALTQH